MRLWHIDLLSYLPKSQLLAQWRELNSIFKKQDKHILINYIYTYDKDYLFNYSCAVLKAMREKNIKAKSTLNFYNFFYEKSYDGVIELINEDFIKYPEHNDEYLTICYWNLREKYLRGQKDFTDKVWQELDKFYKNYMENKNVATNII